MSTQTSELVAFCRERMRGTPPAGNIMDRATLIEVLEMLLESHLERTAPQGTPERVISGESGYITVPAQPAPPWDPSACDMTALELATLLGYLQDRK